MAFHIPPFCTWDPAGISSDLGEQGWCAHVVHSDVLVSAPRLPRTTATWILTRLLGRPPIKIIYNPRRFLINVEIVWDIFRHQRLFDQCHDAIYYAMTKRGYLEASTDYTERELALRYCPANPRLLQVFDEIDDLQREKEELVMRKDYELAAQKRDAAHVLQVEVDTLLFSSFSGR